MTNQHRSKRERLSVWLQSKFGLGSVSLLSARANRVKPVPVPFVPGTGVNLFDFAGERTSWHFLKAACQLPCTHKRHSVPKGAGILSAEIQSSGLAL